MLDMDPLGYVVLDKQVSINHLGKLREQEKCSN